MKQDIIGIYSEDGRIYLSDKIRELHISEQSRRITLDIFNRINKPHLYDRFLRVAVVAEEAAHFVQHTRGQLPTYLVSSEPQTADTDDIPITFTHTAQMDEGTQRLLQRTVRRTFKEMEYQGKPPKELVIGDIFYIDTPDYLPENDPLKVYNQAVFNPDDHCSDRYPFEQEARDIKNRVLRWWQTEEEQLEFALHL